MTEIELQNERKKLIDAKLAEQQQKISDEQLKLENEQRAKQIDLGKKGRNRYTVKMMR